MNLFDILTKGGAKVADLKAMLQWVIRNVPDLAPAAIDMLSKLDAPIDAANVLDLAKSILPEAMDIVHGKLDPRFHPGDAA